MAKPLPDLEEIFSTARNKQNGERTAYLEEVCGHDPALRLRVEQFLGAQAELGSFLEVPAAGRVNGADASGLVEGPGTLIGPYKLLEQIGEGGFGLVFMAEQRQPVRRKVAVKIIKPGMDSKQVIARFEAERQALALMDHPNIARVLEAGETASGRPYFAMELVRGIPITDFCDKNALTLRQRLKLFLTVCAAVQHAHHKAIIHRDIKPSNVLVTLHDGKPVVKVIDFGIAKAIGQQLTDKTLCTGFAQMIGTPLYMSPEQAEMSGLDIDTRSDIYSLGVLLYELLTGSTPLGKERFANAGYDEVRRIIREEDPPRPSTRLSTMGAEATVVSERRQSDPRRLSQLFRGELDWIVMKALEKERTRRYETAAAFGADIERYLHDEPVSACPPSAWYRFRKFARRNKGALGAAALIALALVAGTVVSGWQAIRATWAMNSERQTSIKLEDANNQLALRQQATQQELVRIHQAEEMARRKLFEALVAQARANRLSRRVGQRFGTLEILHEATALARQLKLPAERLLELRHEAIAALALPDLRAAKEWPAAGFFTASFDAKLERYAQIDRQGKLEVLHAGVGQEIHRPKNLGPGNYWPTLSPDGGYLAVFDTGRSRLEVWPLAGAEPARILAEPSLGSHCFSPDSRQLALQQADGSLGIFDLSTRKSVRRLPAGPRVNQMRFHPGGDRLALAMPGQSAQVRDLETGQVLWEKNLRDPWPHLGWHPDGKILALADTETITLWDVPQDKLVGKFDNLGEGINFTFDPSGTLLATTGWAGILRLWDPLSNRQLLSAPFSAVTLQFSEDARYLAATHKDTKLQIWEIAAGHEYRTLVASPLQGKRGYRSVAISGDGRFLAAGAQGPGGVALWDLPGGKELAFLEASPGINYVVLEPRSAQQDKGEATLLAMGERGLFRWPIRTVPHDGAVLVGSAEKLPVSARSDCLIAQSRDGRVLAAAQFDGAVVVHADRPDQLIKLEHRQDARYVAVSPDGKWVATGGFGHPGGAKLWRAKTGQLVKELPVGEFCRPEFSPDSKHLLTCAGATQRAVRRWEVATWREMPFTTPIDGFCPAYSPDGKLLVVESGAGVARLLDPETGREYARLEDPDQHRTNQFAFNSDGTILACATGDGHCVHVWDLQAIRRQLADLGLDW